jgi:hypothetical protein
MPSAALTDINNSTGVMDFVAACRERGIKPIAGIEFRLEDRLFYTGLAKNNEGFRELNEFLSHYNLQNKPLPDRAPQFENVFVIYPFLNTEIRHASRVTCHDPPSNPLRLFTRSATPPAKPSNTAAAAGNSPPP